MRELSFTLIIVYSFNEGIFLALESFRVDPSNPGGGGGGKLYPILDLNSLIYIPYHRVNCLKTKPLREAHTYIAHKWQYLPSLPGPPIASFTPCFNLLVSLSSPAWLKRNGTDDC